MAAKREELLKLAQSPEDRTLLSQLLDKQRQAERYVRPASTAFLDLRQQTLCRQAMQSAAGLWREVLLRRSVGSPSFCRIISKKPASCRKRIGSFGPFVWKSGGKNR